MNSLQLAQQAYTTNSIPLRTEKQIEYEAFAKVTRELRAAAVERTRNFPRFAEALHQNRKLWTLLASSVADEENTLPENLRAQIFYLAEFTIHKTKLILRGEDGIAALLETNFAIMRGLSASGERS